MRNVWLVLIGAAFVAQVALIIHLNGWEGKRSIRAQDMASREGTPLSAVLGNKARTIPGREAGNPALGKEIIRGLVSSRAGNPVSGAVLLVDQCPLDRQDLFAPRDKMPRWSTETDAQGHFKLNTLPPGRFLVMALTTDAHALATLCLEENGPAGELILTLTPSLRIAGSVVDADGQPLKRARVHPMLCDAFEETPIPYEWLCEMTDGAGRFLFEHVHAGSWRLLADAKNYTPALSPPIEAGAKEGTVRLRPGRRLQGTVSLVQTGRAASRVKVRALETGLRVEQMSVNTDGEGRFEFPNVRTGDYRLSILSDQYVMVGGGIQVAVDAVRAHEAPPAQDAPEETADLAMDLSPGKQPADQQAGDSKEEAPLSAAPDPGVICPAIRVARAATIRGRVVEDREKPRGLPGIFVRAVPESGPVQEMRGVTDQAGYYRISGLDADRYVVTVDAPKGHVACNASALTVQAERGKQVIGPEFRVRPGVPVQGLVVDTDGKPVAEANVFVTVENRQQPATFGMRSAPKGSFVCEDLGPGDRIRVWATNVGVESRVFGPLQVGQNGLHEITLSLSRPNRGSISGRVVNAQGRPIAGAAVRCYAPEDTLHATREAATDEDGGFRFARLTPQTFRLIAGRRANALSDASEHSVTLGPNESATGIHVVLP